MLADSITEHNVEHFFFHCHEGKDDYNMGIWPRWLLRHTREALVEHMQAHPNKRASVARSVRNKINRCGKTYQGNQFTLSWMAENCRLLMDKNVRFLIFHNSGPQATQTIPMFSNPEVPGTYLLLYNDCRASHWQVACVPVLTPEEEENKGEEENKKVMLFSAVDDDRKEWFLIKSNSETAEEEEEKEKSKKASTKKLRAGVEL